MVSLPGKALDITACLIDFDFTAFATKTRSSSQVVHHITQVQRVLMSLTLLMADGTNFDPVPHHRPYFDMGSVFWSLYVAVLWDVVVPTMNLTENHFQSQINSFCKEDQQAAGSMKNNALQDWMGWSQSAKLVEGCGWKDVQAVWRLLEKMRHYLFMEQVPEPQEPLKNVPTIPGFVHAQFEGHGDNNKRNKPWTDSHHAVDKAQTILQDMFLHTLKELEELDKPK